VVVVDVVVEATATVVEVGTVVLGGMLTVVVVVDVVVEATATVVEVGTVVLGGMLTVVVVLVASDKLIV
jgi:hypothetical protein